MIIKGFGESLGECRFGFAQLICRIWCHAHMYTLSYFTSNSSECLLVNGTLRDW